MSKHWFIAHLIDKYTSGKKMGLDLGIGYDNWSEFKNCQMIGVDKRKNQETDIILDLENKLPFKNAVFEIVISINVLNFIKDSNNIMSEINRVLKQGGIFLCVVDNKNSNMEDNETWSQSFLDKNLEQNGFKGILKNSLKDYFYAKWYNYSSVYAFNVVKKI